MGRYRGNAIEPQASVGVSPNPEKVVAYPHRGGIASCEPPSRVRSGVGGRSVYLRDLLGRKVGGGRLVGVRGRPVISWGFCLALSGHEPDGSPNEATDAPPEYQQNATKCGERRGDGR